MGLACVETRQTLKCWFRDSPQLFLNTIYGIDCITNSPASTATSNYTSAYCSMCLPHTNVFPVPTMVYAVPCPVNTTHKCTDQAVCSLPRLSHHRHSCCIDRRCYYLIVCRARLWVLAHCATDRPNTRANDRI